MNTLLVETFAGFASLSLIAKVNSVKFSKFVIAIKSFIQQHLYFICLFVVIQIAWKMRKKYLFLLPRNILNIVIRNAIISRFGRSAEVSDLKVAISDMCRFDKYRLHHFIKTAASSSQSNKKMKMFSFFKIFNSLNRWLCWILRSFK